MARYKAQTLAEPKEAPVTSSRLEPAHDPVKVQSVDGVLYYYARKPLPNSSWSEVRDYFIGQISIGICYASPQRWRFVYDDSECPLHMRDFETEKAMRGWIIAALVGKPG